MSASNDAFAVHLYRELARSSGDVLFSPWCLAQVLAMLQLGAAGHTRAEIAALLNGGDAPSIGGAARRYTDGGEDWRVATAAWPPLTPGSVRPMPKNSGASSTA